MHCPVVVHIGQPGDVLEPWSCPWAVWAVLLLTHFVPRRLEIITFFC